MKKKRKPKKKSQGSWLENLLRFEIVVLLFGLIGFYYFLSFSPIRMPKEPIVSPQVKLAPLPPIPVPVVTVPEEEVLPVVKVAVVEAVVTGVDSDNRSPTAISNEDSIPRKDLASNEEPASQSVEPVEEVSLPPVEPAQADSSVSVSKSESVPVAASDSVPAPSPVPVPVSVPVSTSLPTVQMAVEVGSYVLQSDVQRFSSQLEELGFVVETESVKRLTPMYKVFLGLYTNRQKAREMMAEARKLGDHPFLRKQGLGYTVVIASFYLESSVIAWENMYHEAGFEPQVQKVDLMVPQTLIMLDGPQVNQDSQAVLDRIQASGFPEARLVKSGNKKK